jgi:hypothetical protein
MKKGEDVRARGAAAGCKELCMDTKLATLRAYIRIADRVVTSEPERQNGDTRESYPRMISITSPSAAQAGRGSEVTVSPPKALMSSVRLTSASEFVSSSEKFCSSGRKSTRGLRMASVKAGHRESVPPVRSRGMRW